MKFFSTALAALAVGSAVAAPLVAPCPCAGKDSGVSVPDVKSSCPSENNQGPNTPGLDIKVPGLIGSEGHHEDNSGVVVVVEAVVEAVVSVEAKVKAHLDLIGM